MHAAAGGWGSALVDINSGGPGPWHGALDGFSHASETFHARSRLTPPSLSLSLPLEIRPIGTKVQSSD
jgi:hypothetical protein